MTMGVNDQENLNAILLRQYQMSAAHAVEADDAMKQFVGTSRSAAAYFPRVNQATSFGFGEKMPKANAGG